MWPEGGRVLVYRGMRKYRSVKLRKKAASINACGCLSWLGSACDYRDEFPEEFATLVHKLLNLIN